MPEDPLHRFAKFMAGKKPEEIAASVLRAARDQHAVELRAREEREAQQQREREEERKRAAARIPSIEEKIRGNWELQKAIAEFNKFMTTATQELAIAASHGESSVYCELAKWHGKSPSELSKAAWEKQDNEFLPWIANRLKGEGNYYRYARRSRKEIQERTILNFREALESLTEYHEFAEFCNGMGYSIRYVIHDSFEHYPGDEGPARLFHELRLIVAI